MITVSSEATSVLAGSGILYYVGVESWLGGQLLASSVPVDTAGEETDRGVNVPERVTLTVPRLKDGYDWSPNSATHPLAAKGQRLYVKLGIGLSQGRVEWFQRGQFLIYETDTDDDTVTVQAVGLFELINQARLISPFQPTGGLVATLRSLIEPALTVLVDSSLTDRTPPGSINYDEDRLGAVNELLDAWPATAYVDPAGFLRVTAPTQSTSAVLSLTDARSGTVITATGSSSRAGGANAIVARGTASDGSQLQGVAYITSGPDAYGGPYNPLAVPFFFQSPLLTTQDQCTLAAKTIRDRRQRQTSREFSIVTVPNPTIQVGDVVAVTSARLGLVAELGTVEALTLPYVADSGQMPPMELTVRTLA